MLLSCLSFSKKLTYIFALACISMASCTFKTTFKETKVNAKYTVLLPEYLVSTTGMHPQASLQYHNEEKEFYVLIIDESKEDMQAYDLNYDIDTYFNNIVSTPFRENIKDGKVSIPGRQTINGAKALIAEITGNINNTDIFYKMAVVETEKNFYQVLTWTRADQKDDFEKDMLTIIESFKEIKQAPEQP